MGRIASSSLSANIAYKRGKLLQTCKVSKRFEVPIIVENCVQSMRNSKYGAVLELFSYCLLYKLICRLVNSGRGLIHDQDATLPQQRSSEAQKLALPHRKVCSTLCH